MSTRLVAGDGRLRGERVHRLGARDARQQLEREARDAGVAQRGDAVEGLVRLQQTDEHRVALEEAHLVRAGRLDLEHHVGAEGVGRVDQGRRRELLVAGCCSARRRRCSTSTSAPSAAYFSATAGMTATRVSPGAVSRGTPMVTDIAPPTSSSRAWRRRTA